MTKPPADLAAGRGRPHASRARGWCPPRSIVWGSCRTVSAARPYALRLVERQMGDLLFLARRDRANHICIQDPRQPGRYDDLQPLVLTRNRMSQAKTCLLIYEALEPYIHDASAERASSACKHSSCNSCRMLRTKLPGSLHNGPCSCIEPLTESSIISRSVIGAFGESGGNRNWRYNNHAYIRPKLTRILHLFSLSHEISGDNPCGPPIIASQPLRGQRRYSSPRRPYGPGG